MRRAGLDRGLAERLLLPGRLARRQKHSGAYDRLRRDGSRPRLHGDRLRGNAVVERSLLDAFVADAGRDHRSRREHRGLDRDARADRGSAAAAEEADERGGQRDRAERLQGAALGALAAGEAGAVLALAQVRAQRPLVLAREAAVELPRDRELGLVAGDPVLELLAQRAAGAEDQRLDRAHAQAEDLGDLLVAAALELAHHERRTLVEGEVAERAADVLGPDRVLLDDRLGELLLVDDLGRATLRLAEALAADVVRDRDQPVLRRARPLALLHRPVGVQEGRLRDVLGVRLVAQDDQRVPVDVAGMPAVEPLEGAVRAESPSKHRCHYLERCRISADLAPRRRVTAVAAAV